MSWSHSHIQTHHGDLGLLQLEIVFLKYRREGFLQRLTGLHHDPHCLTSEGNLQPETHMHYNELPQKRKHKQYKSQMQ